jgi:hypothetical protein
MRARPTVWEAILCVCRRPWPWVIRYTGGLAPAFLIALLLLISLRSWVSQPLVAEMLETRSLDLFADALMNLSGAIEDGPLLWAGIVLIPQIWIGIRLLWLFLEGGVLITYTQPKRPTIREFLCACLHWFPSFLMISISAAFVTVAVVGIASLSVVLVQILSLWMWLRTAVIVVGVAGVAGISAAAELVRAAAVVRKDRNVWRALCAAGRVAVHRFVPLVALIIGTLLLRGLFFLVQRALPGWIPLSWWLPTLLVQQSLQIAVTGLGLARRAGEVALMFPVSGVCPSPVPMGEGPDF